MVAASGQTSGIDSEPTTHWKCEVGQTLEQVLHIPIRNKVKDQALITLAQMVSTVVGLVAKMKHQEHQGIYMA